MIGEVTRRVDGRVDSTAGLGARKASARPSTNERLEDEGKTDETSSNLKQAGEDIKDAFKS